MYIASAIFRFDAYQVLLVSICIGGASYEAKSNTHSYSDAVRARHDAGLHWSSRGANPGDPPTAWLMPLVGDAVIGIAGLFIVFLVLKKTGLWVWTTIIVWNSLAIWDALSAFIIHNTKPWPEFFIVQMLGSSMFFATSAMHLAIIFLMSQPELRTRYLG